MDRIALALLLGGFLGARLQVFRLDADQVFTDTASYVRVAGHRLNEQGFWAGERPFTVPMIYKALGLHLRAPLDDASVRRATYFQLGLSIAAWMTLATVAAHATHGRWSRLTGFGLILAFGASLDIAQWDRILLSESVSSSLFALVIGSSIAGVRVWSATSGGHRRARQLLLAVGTSLVLVLFSFSRDTNGYVLLASSVLLTVSMAVGAVRTHSPAPGAVIIAVIMAVTFYIQNRSADQGERWLGPFLNVFSARILPVEEFVEYFSDRGLPADAITEEMYLGRSVFLSQLQQTQDGGRLLEWIEKNGKPTYLQFLASRPVQSFGKPILSAGSMVNVDSSEYRLRERPDPAWAVLITSLMFPGHAELLIAAGLLSSAVVLATTDRNQVVPLIVTGFALIILAYPLAIVIWHADTIELERHSYQLALQLRLAAWLLIIAALPSLFGFARKMTRSPRIAKT